MQLTVRSADARRARSLQARLAAHGVEAAALTGPARAARARFTDECTILDATAGDDWMAAEAASLRAGAAPPLCILGASPFTAPPAAATPAVDGWLDLDAPAAILRADIADAARLAHMRDELALRRRTTQALGFAIDADEPDGGPRAIFVGEADPFYLALDHDLRRDGGAVAATHTAFAAFDCLHDESFDGVILSVGADAPAALALCGAMRRNSRLQHLPTAFLAPGADDAFREAALARGASLVLSARGAYDSGLDWMRFRMRRQRAAARTAAQLSATCAAHAGPYAMFGADFFDAHLDALAEDAHERGRPLSLVAFQAQLAPGARAPVASAWRKTVHQVTDIIGCMIRQQDTAALLDHDLILIAMPALTARDAGIAAERAAAVAECTAFAPNDGDRGPVVLARHIAELAPGESGHALAARAARAFGASEVRA